MPFTAFVRSLSGAFLLGIVAAGARAQGGGRGHLGGWDVYSFGLTPKAVAAASQGSARADLRYPDAELDMTTVSSGSFVDVNFVFADGHLRHIYLVDEGDPNSSDSVSDTAINRRFGKDLAELISRYGPPADSAAAETDFRFADGGSIELRRAIVDIITSYPGPEPRPGNGPAGRPARS